MLRREYAGEWAACIGRCWVHKMQYFFNQALASGDVLGRRFTLDEVAAYEEPSELGELHRDAAGVRAVQRRITRLRHLFKDG